MEKISANPQKVSALVEEMEDIAKIKDISSKKKPGISNKLGAVFQLNKTSDKNRSEIETVDELDLFRAMLAKKALGDGPQTSFDVEPLIGEVKMQIQRLDKLKIEIKDYKTFYLLVRLPGVTKNWVEKEIYPHALASFKYAMRFVVMNILVENIGNSIIFKLVGQNHSDIRVDLGKSLVPWKKTVNIPNQWVINSNFTFEGEKGKESP